MRVQPVMRCLILFLLLTVSVSVMAQSVSNKSDATNTRRSLLLKADDIVTSATVNQTPAYQRQLWKEETAVAVNNAPAWLNLYLWTSRDKALPDQNRLQELDDIFGEAARSVSASAEYSLLRYLHSARKDTAALNAALTKTSNKQSIYPYLVQHAVITQNLSLLRRYAAELQAIEPLPGGLIEYHQNVLASADSGSIIYAAGINDLVPLAMVQQVRGFRKDVRLKFYDGTTVHEPNAYLCLSLGRDVLAAYPSAGYSGLLVKTSGASITELQRHLQQFDLAILMSDNVFLNEKAPAIYRNYLPPMLLLYRHLRSTNSNEAALWRDQLERLSKRTGDWETVKKQMAGQ